MAGDAADEVAAFRLAGDDGVDTIKVAFGARFDIEPQIGFATRGVWPVTLKAVVGQDRADVAIETHRVVGGRRCAFSDGECQNRSAKAGREPVGSSRFVEIAGHGFLWSDGCEVGWGRCGGFRPIIDRTWLASKRRADHSGGDNAYFVPAACLWFSGGG